MKFLVIHNDYGTRSGEEVTVDNHCRLLREHGHVVVEYRRSSAEIAAEVWAELGRSGRGSTTPAHAGISGRW